ncbi:MAG: flavin reductase family protein [Acidobacteriota bacterium]
MDSSTAVPAPQSPTPVDTGNLRDALSRWAAGVTIVAAADANGDDRHGMTATAFSSVSVDPPLVAVMINRSHTISRFLADGTGVTVNVLAADQRPLADRFAFVKDEDRFLVGDWQAGPTGVPVLGDALTWLAGRVERLVEVGSHYVVIVAVTEVATPRADAAPLIYWHRDYRQLHLASSEAESGS